MFATGYLVNNDVYLVSRKLHFSLNNFLKFEYTFFIFNKNQPDNKLYL